MNFKKLVLASTAVGLAGNALAVTPYDSIVTAVSWTDVTTGIVSIAALVAAVLVVVRGSKFLLRMIGR